jgi:imidazolonepropionase
MPSILAALNLAAVEFGLSVDECLVGATREAARALGRLADTGMITVGRRCDLAIWDAIHPEELVLQLGQGMLHRRIYRGEVDEIKY